MQFSTRTHCLIKFALVTGLTLCSLTACKGIGHSIGGASDDAGRAAAKAGAKTTSPKILTPQLNSGTQKSYKVVKVRQSADELIASVDTANGLYEVYVDCRTGIITRGQVPPTEQVNVVSEVCQFVVESSNQNASTNGSLTEANTQPVDPVVGAKEQAWQNYYQSCNDLGNAEWRAQKSQELGREFTDEDVYNNFEAQWRGMFESEWKKTGDRPRGCG